MKSICDLYLLIWKNFIFKKRQPCDSISTVCISGGCCLLICLLAKYTQRISHKAVSYSSFTVDSSPPIIGDPSASEDEVPGEGVRALVLFWSPCGNPFLTTLVVNVAINLKMAEKCYRNKNELQAALQYYGNKPIIGLQFDDILAKREKFTKTLKIVVRFPEIHTRSQSGNYWKTASNFPVFYDTGPREPENITGGEPYYHKRGFLTLQNYVSKEFVKSYSHDELPLIQMRRFPHPAWKSYDKMSLIGDSCCLLLLIAFAKLFSGVLRDVAIEKETQIKEIMKIMGVNNWLHWIAWYLSTLLFSLIIIFVNVMILTTPITKEDAVFSNVDRKVLLVFFLIYTSAMITFAFAVTVCFTRASTATIVGEVLFMVSTIPYFVSLTFSEKLSSCLLINTAFLRGIQIIIDHEMIFKNLTMGNIFDPVSENESLSLGLVMMMLILDTFIYMLIVLYVEAIFPGEYGLPRVWYFPFTVKFWRTKSAVFEHVKTFIHEDNYYEPEPVDQKIGIQVLHLKKQYGKHRIILRDLSFNMFEGEVTILLGHNGAGKTTTMSILSGILPTTCGTAIINGYDIRTDMDKIRRSLGFCPQNNVLFDLLTAREHLYFYCKMRGLRGQILKEEINKYLRLLDFTNKKEVVSRAFSGGMKRKLCTGIALCGNSKICILDEPTSGMDPTNRRLLWDVIQSEKTGRTILLSTHFMNEADVLGDRIAILANGRLQCYGSSYFLKKRYGSGYRLVIVKDSQCKAEQITAFLQDYIPQLNIETDVGRELTYILPEFHVRIFERMLSNMDNSRQSLGIESYGISLATLEEVFIKVGAECDEDNDNLSDIVLEAGLLDNHETYLTGFALYGNQVLAMMLKRALVTMRSWLVLIALTALAVLTSILTMQSWRTGSQISSSPRLDFTLDSYSSPVTVITATTKNNTYYKNYKEVLQNENRKIVDRGNEDMNDYLLKKTSESMDQVRTHFIIGATFFGNNTIVAWFNDQPYHSPPLALQYVYNSILKEKVGPDYNIEFGNYPFRETTEDANTGFAFLYNVMTISMFVTFVVPYYTLFCVKERVCQSKHLQLSSGADVSAFWLVTFIWDLTTFIFISFWVVIIMICYNARINYGAVVILLIVFGFAILPFLYLMAFLFKRQSSAYSGVSLFGVLVVISFYILRLLVDRLTLMPLKIIDGLFLYFPIYSLLCGVYNVSLLYDWKEMCDTVNKQFEQVGEKNITTTIDYACSKVPEICCDLGYYSMGNGISKNIIYMLTTGIILFLLLFIHEYGIRSYLVYIMTFCLRTPPKTEGTEDADVLEEKRLIRQGIIQPSTHEVLLKNTTKYFKTFLAVNQLCIGIKQYECFGLLGVNGAGKTTVFKMMTGDLRLSYGDAWICRLNVKNNMKDVHRCIGYCPQFDGLLDNLTVKETLIMYCLIRGIPLANCSAAAIRLSQELQFTKHINKRINNLSGGNKRKVSAAIALIGEPLVLFLDEPSTGMDPKTKRFLWDKLCRIRDNGRCLVLTTHSMDECEAICTRVGIMVNGAFQCLGSSQYLKNKFADGYVLIIKVKKGTDMQELQSNIQEVKLFVDRKFRGAELKESHGRLLSYIVKGKSISWPAVFGTMERGKTAVKGIEDYSLSQFDLEQIFLLFTRMQT